MFKHKIFKQKGAALYLSIVVLSIITSALLAMLAVVLTQSSTIWTLGNSVFAFYGADTGIERVLYKVYQTNLPAGWLPTCFNECIYPDCGGCAVGNCLTVSSWETVFGSVKYQVCSSGASLLEIWSTGEYKETRRKIQINF